MVMAKDIFFMGESLKQHSSVVVAGCIMAELG
jgi:hypothetical protein